MGKRSVRRNKAKKKIQSKSESKKEPLKKSNTSFYDKYYKILLIIPFLLLALSIAQISIQYSSTGDFIHKGVSLSGGISITIEKELDISFKDLETSLNSEFPEFDSSVREITTSGGTTGLIVQSTYSDSEVILDFLEKQIGVLDESEYTSEMMGSHLGEQFFRQIFTALIFAFILMGIVVLIYFRSFGPSIAVILSAISDIVITASIVNLTGMKLSTAGIAAFLMLIGYSVDTDILLSTKMIRGKGSLNQRIVDAMKTGLMMSFTTIIAVGVAILVTQSEIIRQIMIIVIIGLTVDLMTTWIQNASILKWVLERTKK